MDKNTFTSYEYLSTNNPELESDQFFVIQDDGTFLLNRQVQYVAEVQDVNEGIDGTPACAVYDVNPQQFFVDVGNNPGELISVADNYILPAPVSEEVNNLYGNSFLLQTVGTEASEQVEKDMTVTVQFKESEDQEEVDVVNIINKQGNSCTEITLTDEQYTNLQQKGWVLIESNGKIFILDAFGLHEVTTNHELIHNLKDANKIDLPEEVDSSSLVTDSQTYPVNIENLVFQSTPLEQETVDIPLKNEKKENEKEDLSKTKLEINEKEQHKEKQVLEQTPANGNKTLETNNNNRLHPEPQKYQSSKIKILTKYSFKDIPDKIVLGKTRNGKKLVAKVVKRGVSQRKFESGDEVQPKGSAVEPAKTPEFTITEEDTSAKVPDIDDAEFNTLVQRAIVGGVECSPDEVVDASDVITQLFQVTEFSNSVAGRNVVITRVREKKTYGGISPSISFVSGFVKSAESGGLLFIHVPHLLQKLTYEYEEYFQNQSSRSVLKPIAEKALDCKILQVHIAETKHNGVQAISFILNERLLPCVTTYRANPRRTNKLHACSACATIFQSEAALAQHQADYSHASDADDALTIDTDRLPKIVQTYTIMESRYYIAQTSKGKEYCCFQCTKKFNKLSNCIRHMKIVHPSEAPIKSADKSTSKTDLECNITDNTENIEEVIMESPPRGPYRCKMCPSIYDYPASLSKHISQAHIVHKVNAMIHT